MMAWSLAGLVVFGSLARLVMVRSFDGLMMMILGSPTGVMVVLGSLAGMVVMSGSLAGVVVMFRSFGRLMMMILGSLT